MGEPDSSSPSMNRVTPDRRAAAVRAQHREVGHHTRLVVGGAAAVEPAVAFRRLERRARPLVVPAGGLDVVVGVEQHRGAAFGPGEMRDDRGRATLRRDDPDLGGARPARQLGDGLRAAAGVLGVGRVGPDAGDADESFEVRPRGRENAGDGSGQTGGRKTGHMTDANGRGGGRPVRLDPRRHDLSAGSALSHVPGRLAAASASGMFVLDRRHLAGLDEPGEDEQVRGVSDVMSVPKLLVDERREHGRRADGRVPPSHRRRSRLRRRRASAGEKRAPEVGERTVPSDVEDDVEALPAVGDVGARVVDDVVRADRRTNVYSSPCRRRR